jgi:hybrid polyketide synthase/nonribosomal peptide synthetase ACE1
MESQTTVPADWTMSLPSGKGGLAETVAAVASQLVAQKILKITSFTGTIVIHEPTELLAADLTQKTQDLSVDLVFTTAIKGNAHGWLYIPQSLPQRLVQKVLPAFTAVFIDLSFGSASTGTGQLVHKCLPQSCSVYSSDSLYGATTEVRPGSSPTHVSTTFKAACSAVFTNHVEVIAPVVVQLGDLKGVSVNALPLAVVDCSAATVPVHVQAIDSGIIFRADRTYLLVGMSGQVGQSLCQWMIERGARHVVLTSRRPQVHSKFIASMEEMGAIFKALAL